MFQLCQATPINVTIPSGWFEYDQGAYHRAAALFNRSLRLWQEPGDKRAIAAELSSLARVIPPTRAAAKESLRLFYELNDLGAVAYLRNGRDALAIRSRCNPCRAALWPRQSAARSGAKPVCAGRPRRLRRLHRRRASVR